MTIWYIFSGFGIMYREKSGSSVSVFRKTYLLFFAVRVNSDLELLTTGLHKKALLESPVLPVVVVVAAHAGQEPDVAAVLEGEVQGLGPIL
jgi:hypothetical protein